MNFIRCAVLAMAVQALAWCAPADGLAVGKEVKWRSIGPYRGGRVVAVAGSPAHRDTYYFGATGGGVWKTTDGGENWTPISDGAMKTGTVGSIEVSASDPNVIYVGMGEGCIRGNVSHGDGLYKSIDGGKTWKHAGLGDSRHVPRVRIHPRNPEIVYAAALGHIFGPGGERGVYKSTDSGKTWKQVLSKAGQVGAIDLSMDPNDPNVLYAAMWQVKRTPYSMESGGPLSGLFKTTDGGETWEDLSEKPGMPKGPLGRIGVSVSAANSDRVYAVVEAADGGVFRSDDGGKTWARTNTDRNLRQRAWYYTHVFADPVDPERVYVENVQFWRSDDAGRTFKAIRTQHSDTHDLWIDPKDNQRMICGDDGGAGVTVNGGKSWTAQDQPTAQFYRVALDKEFPYNIYGAQQDNSTVRIPSRTTGFGITDRDWWDVGGGESGWIAPDPRDADVVFAGSYGGYLTRYDHKTGQVRAVNVWPDNPMGYGAEGMKYRFQWNFPILFSPHDPSVLYTGGNMLFKSLNEGQSWTAVSPDLTRNDKTKMGPSGGPITKDNTSVEYYGTIFTVSESPVKKGVIWTGSDDGLVHVTTDGGKTWSNVTPPKEMMPEWIQINSIDASPHDAATCWVAATMYKSDDFKPYLYVTRDSGKSWKKIVAGLPEDSFTRVIREDPARGGLLYAGTETGMWLSMNGGESWESLQSNLPAVPITDLAVHKEMKDLVAATQGRSFWVLDDLAVIHDLFDKRKEIEAAGVYLYPVEAAYRMPGGRARVQGTPTFGENPTPGAVFNYRLKEKPKGELTIEVFDAAGKSVRKLSSKADSGEGEARSGAGGRRGRGAAEPLPAEPGVNRASWNMQYPDAKDFPGLIMWAGSVTGPVAAPGKYTAKLTVGSTTVSREFEIRKDPRLSTTQQDFDKQLALLLQIRDKLTETHEAILTVRDVRKQVEDAAARYRDLPAGKEIGESAKALATKLTAVEEELYQTKLQSSQDPLNYPIRLNNKLAALGGIVGSADTAPTDQSYQLHEELTSKINVQLRTLEGLLKADLEAFNRLVKDKNVPAVLPAAKR